MTRRGARRRWAGPVAVVLGVAALGASAPPSPAGGVPGGPSAAAPGRPPAAAPGEPGATAPAEPGVGSAGLGDRLFPALGNGGYDVQRYDLSLRYPGRERQEVVSGSATITARATQDLTRFSLDFAGRRPTDVEVDGAPARWRLFDAELTVTPQRPLRPGQRFAVRLRGFGAVPTAPDGEGVRPFFLSREGSAVVAQPDGAHLVFPANDHPSDKAAFSFTLDTVDDVHAVANGVLTGRRTAGGRTVWRYEQRRPMATNLVQVAVGDFTVTDRGRHHGVDVRDVTPRRHTRRLLPELAVEIEQLGWMRDRVGPFPFPTYGSLVVDAPLGFALETQTLSVFDLTALTQQPVADRRPLLMHELAHQWFGNSVTPASWSDLWLSEGHATWYQLLYAEEKGYLLDDQRRRTTLVGTMREVYGAADRLRRAYGPVARPASAEELFSPQVYVGGALVLYALRQEIGAAAFERLQRTWVTRYEGRSASTADFVATASSVAGRDLEPFLAPWLTGQSTPEMPGHPDWTVGPG